MNGRTVIECCRNEREVRDALLRKKIKKYTRVFFPIKELGNIELVQVKVAGSGILAMTPDIQPHLVLKSMQNPLFHMVTVSHSLYLLSRIPKGF
jgi:hypothetical protein